MIKFLLNGIIRDKSRSILPIIIVAIGVALTVLMSGYLKGVFGDIITQSAKFDTGHVKLMSKSYFENMDQLPNDLALLDVEELIQSLRDEHPEMDWVKRIKFGGLIDVLDGEEKSKGQGPVAGLSYEIYSGNGSELERLDFEKSIVSGKLPSSRKEILMSAQFAENLQLSVGDEVSYLGSTMNGSMAFTVFKISGLVKFGMPAMDRGTIIADVSDVQQFLDMENGSSEILGYLKDDIYIEEKIQDVASTFNARYENSSDEFDPIMLPLREQSNLGALIDTGKIMSGIMIFIFILAMSVVLWNTGLLAGIRRFKEFGIRLSLGETKGHIYKTFTYEGVLVGLIGSVLGTLIGLAGVYYLQVKGFDISSMSDQIDSSLMMPTVLRSRVTWDLFVIGFIPGVFAMVFGNMLSGLGIYKRETASLMKELEV